MLGLHYLELQCKSMHDQDLAALQHIPHVSLELFDFSSFLLTSGSWESLQISGYGDFSVNFSNADAFVRGTKRFLFECSSSHEAEEMYGLLRAACMRQWVACHECERTDEYPDKIKVAYLINMKLCRGPQEPGCPGRGHKSSQQEIFTDTHCRL